MDNYSDADLLRGINDVINLQNVRSGVDYDEIAKQIIQESELDLNSDAQSDDPDDMIKREMNKIANELGIDTDNIRTATPRQQTPSAGKSPGFNTTAFTPSRLRNVEKFNSPVLSPYDEAPEAGNSVDDFLDDYPSPVAQRHDSSIPRDIEARTIDERRHEQVVNVKDKLGDKRYISLDEIDREDQKTCMLDKIDSLRQTLVDEGENLENIQFVDKSSDYKLVENVLRLLELKYDRIRYTSFADEGILLMASVVEDIFDGQRKILGRTPNMKGWSKEVQVKTRRMRLETGNIVGGFMRNMNFGPVLRILLELVPNGIMYCRRKSQNNAKPKIQDDKDISAYINNIRNSET